MIATKQHYALEEVCLRITDGSHFSPKDDVNGVFPMLSVKDMGMTGFVYDTCKYINENDYQTLIANGCKPSINDVLVAKDGSYLKTAFVQKEDKEQVLLSSIAILTPNIEILYPDYLAYFFKSNHTRNVVERHYLTGTAIKRIILKGFRKILIPVPPLPEQEKIASELDCLSGIIEKKRQQLKELDALAQSIFYEMFGNPVDNERGWEVKKLGEIANISSGGTPSRKKNEYFTGDINWYSAGELNSLYLSDSIEKITKDAIDKSAAKLFKANSLLVGMYDTAAFKLGILRKDSASNQACANVELHFDNVVWMYYLLSLMKEEALKYRHGIRQKNLNVGFIKSFMVPLPPLPLQQSFAQKIEAIEQQKALIKQSIAEVETLFNARMQEYFE